MEKFFKLGLRGTDKKTEIIAGLTTLMTRAYVLAVQPAAICGGEAYITDVNGVVITKSAIMITCALVSGLITLLMAFYTNFPCALSTGMGSNFSLGALIQSQALSFGAAMVITLISGIVFVLLTVFGLRDLIVRVIPKNIKIAISASIGFLLPTSASKTAASARLKTASPSATSPIPPCCWPSAACCSSLCSTP